MDDLAGEEPVADLEVRGHHVLDAEFAGDRLDLVGRRGRHHADLMAAPPVRVHDGARLRVDLGGEFALEDILADRCEFLLREAAQRAGGSREE